MRFSRINARGGMRMKIFMNTGLLLMVVILSTPEVLANPPLAYEGRRLYVSYCMLCHGPEGKGDGPLAKVMEIKPADLSTTVRSRSDTILTKIITGEGRQVVCPAEVTGFLDIPAQYVEISRQLLTYGHLGRCFSNGVTVAAHLFGGCSLGCLGKMPGYRQGKTSDAEAYDQGARDSPAD